MGLKLLFSVTTYKGFEEEIRGLLNRNRSHEHTRQYLDWRYLGESTSPPPLVFWLRKRCGQPVGMASLISRPYWVIKSQSRIWVLGDISLDLELRGKGLGQLLFRNMNAYIKRNLKGSAFVIPNAAAQKALTSTGWSNPCQFSWFLSVVDPVAKYFPWLEKKKIFQQCSAVIRQLMSIWLAFHCDKNFELVTVFSFDGTFDELWESLKKENLIIRDRGQASLRWRFEQHPLNKYYIKTFLYGGGMAGYIIYEVDESGMCKIVDLIAAKRKFFRPMVALLLRKICKDESIKTVRIKLNYDNMYGSELKKLGFVVKTEKDVFQYFNPTWEEMKYSSKWFVTVADKDT